MEVNHFLLLSCSLEKNFWQNDSLIKVLVDNAQFSSVYSQYSLRGIYLSGGNYFLGKFYSEGAIFWSAIFFGSNYPRWQLSGGQLSGGQSSTEQLSWGQFSSGEIVQTPPNVMLEQYYLFLYFCEFNSNKHQKKKN